MPYSDKTQEQILADLLANTGDQYDKTPGYLPYDSNSALSIELAGVSGEQADILKQAFPQTCTVYEIMVLHAAAANITPNLATKASAPVTLSGANGTVIPAGSLVSTQGGIQYETTAEATIVSASIDTSVRALITGTAGNVPTGAISSIPVSIPGVTAVTNASPAIGGTEQEGLESLRERILEAERLPATSGNEAHYKVWAKDVDGVGDARVLSLWAGAGTVKVILIDANKQPASGPIVTEAAAYIETQRPIGATVTVVSATALAINSSAALTLDSGYTLLGVTPAVEAAITAYLSGIAFKGPNTAPVAVSYAQISTAILSVPGVLDHTGLLVNTGTANIAVSNTQVAIKGTVTLS